MNNDTDSDLDFDKFDFDTRAIRAGTVRSQFNEHSEALFLTSSFRFKNAAQAAARFAHEEHGPIYSRFTNPTVSMFTDRLASLEGAPACVATSSGMSAILGTVMGLLKSGDHIVCSAGVFGATVQMFGTIFAKFGIQSTFVPSVDASAWKAAVKPNTRLLFVETPSNPLLEVFDIAALKAVAKQADALLVVDNCLCTPALHEFETSCFDGRYVTGDITTEYLAAVETQRDNARVEDEEDSEDRSNENATA
jgi:O-succinylhomoserine sulfhydrylase